MDWEWQHSISARDTGSTWAYYNSWFSQAVLFYPQSGTLAKFLSVTLSSWIIPNIASYKPSQNLCPLTTQRHLNGVYPDNFFCGSWHTSLLPHKFLQSLVTCYSSSQARLIIYPTTVAHFTEDPSSSRRAGQSIYCFTVPPLTSFLSAEVAPLKLEEIRSTKVSVKVNFQVN